MRPGTVCTLAPFFRALVSAHNYSVPSVSSDLQPRVAALRWYHTIDLGNGIVTRGVDDTPLRLARLELPASFAGQTVLDIGAWDGFFSFEAERRGASRVVAADYYSWHGGGWGPRPASSWRAPRSGRTSKTSIST